MKKLLSLLAAIIFTTGCSATAQDSPAGEVVLKVGDQKGGAKALLTAAGLLNDFPYKIEWSTFTSGPPLLEARPPVRSTSAVSATRRRSSPPPRTPRSPRSVRRRERSKQTRSSCRRTRLFGVSAS
ncbi:hypothetical protein [Lentzea indica]|uniref:hypothetical protein n=1 Tax=Lentzea indica TaxID=2604800 RepID=UPI0035E45FAF